MLEKVKAKLKEYDQEHLLKYYDELSDGEKKALLEEIEATDFDVLNSLKNALHAPKRGVITPIESMELPEIKEKEAAFRAKGLEAIKKGEVAAVLLAGGMGTRLGSDDPKGMYNIGLTKEVYIFQRLIENLMDVVNEAGVFVPLYIMTSDKNNDKTVKFMKEKNYFGYNPDYIHFFKQEMAPASDYEGHILLEGKGKLATSPNGNAGWYVSMHKAGLSAQAIADGVKWINIFAVDNVLQRIADPVFVGAVIEGNFVSGAKVVRKVARDEKVGAMCLEDGRPSIVEYYEMTDELMDAKNEKGDPAYNFGVILNYLFSIDELERIREGNLPLHVVEKKIPYIDENGNFVSPTEPNGYKFEQLVLDMIYEMKNCLPFEVVREFEFAPIKNKTGIDSVESARELCKKNGIEL
ncbi:MAG: UTP--glucose-1-phosphate uridylyltransferase [Lachnospiraceae bacterium]|nr:UTP--glucose-1-phosphate uridylyltransferase [Lachnospiraceae bacterium]